MLTILVYITCYYKVFYITNYKLYRDCKFKFKIYTLMGQKLTYNLYKCKKSTKIDPPGLLKLSQSLVFIFTFVFW